MKQAFAGISLVMLGSFWPAHPSAAAEAPATPSILSQPDPDSPFGERNALGPDELEQFAFVIGDWDVDVTVRDASGRSIQYQARWHNIWIVDGLVIYQEWRGPYATGAEFRTFDKNANTWAGYNFYPGGRGWYDTSSVWREDANEMIVTSRRKSECGEAINQEIYYDITPLSFKIRSRLSCDEGQSWKPASFQLTAMRKR